MNLKKYIDFKIENEKNKEKIIIKITNPDITDLSADEKVIFEFLKKACKEKDEITVKDFQKYINLTLKELYKEQAELLHLSNDSSTVY